MSNRASRVAEIIKEEISLMLEYEVKDPRVGLVTITDVEVSPDLRHAKAFFSTLEKSEKKEQTLAGLESAKGYIRRELGKRLRMKYIPEIEFHFDLSIEKGMRIAEIIHKIKEK